MGDKIKKWMEQGYCAWCGKESPKEILKRFRGLCMDCLDETIVEEFGEKSFDELVSKGFKTPIGVVKVSR
jgi:hypothetical protein